MTGSSSFDYGRDAYFNVADRLAQGETVESMADSPGATPAGREWIDAAEEYASDHGLPWPPPADEYEVARIKAREHDLSP